MGFELTGKDYKRIINYVPVDNHDVRKVAHEAQKELVKWESGQCTEHPERSRKYPGNYYPLRFRCPECRETLLKHFKILKGGRG